MGLTSFFACFETNSHSKQSDFAQNFSHSHSPHYILHRDFYLFIFERPYFWMFTDSFNFFSKLVVCLVFWGPKVPCTLDTLLLMENNVLWVIILSLGLNITLQDWFFFRFQMFKGTGLSSVSLHKGWNCVVWTMLPLV